MLLRLTHASDPLPHLPPDFSQADRASDPLPPFLPDATQAEHASHLAAKASSDDKEKVDSAKVGSTDTGMRLSDSLPTGQMPLQ